MRFTFSGIIKMLLACLLPVFSQVYGQGYNDDISYFNGEKKFTGGIAGGVNICQIDGDAYYGYNKLRFLGGGIVYWNFLPKAGISVELDYTQKGARGIDEAYSPYVGPYFGKYNLNINYVEIPVIFHYYITPKYHLGLGASYAQLINSSERYDGVDTYIFPAERFPFKKSNIDFVASASMVLYKGLMANVRYQYSLTPIRNAVDVPQGFGYGNQGQVNNMFSLRLIYLF